MRNFIAPVAILLSILVISAGQLAQSQVATGTPSFNSYGGGPFDTVNLGNLNVRFTVPIIHKAGRGMPFGFDLAYDSSIWKPVTTGTTTRWTPAPNWGWQQKGSVGYISYTMTSSDCQYFVTQTQQWITAYTQYFYTNWTFNDDSGVAHPLSGTTQTWQGHTQPGTSCSGIPPDIPTATGTATDGSGYTLSISAYTHGVVTNTTGIKVDNTSGVTITDANGNQIKSDATGSNYFDTLSSTAPVLTVSGWNFTYVGPSGSKQITTTYKSYTVKTNFGYTTSPAISEYGPSAASLIDSINLPDGSQYKFTYEPTPGTCTPLTGTDPSSCVTARIASVTIPTGGIISYSYTGSHGIFSDGSTSGLSRTVNPGGTWTYVRSSSGPTWTTAINSPSHPKSPSGTTTDGLMLSFRKDTTSNNNCHEYWRQVYDGGTSGGTLLGTVETLYNGGTWPNSTITSPITSVQTTTKFASGATQSIQTTSYNSVGLPTTISAGQVGGATRTTTISYASLGNNIVNHPSSVSVSDANNNVISKTTYAYDEAAYPVVAPSTATPQHIGITGSRGNPTTITNYKTISVGLTRHTQYYDTGTPYKVYDVNNQFTTYVYGTATQGNTTVSCGNSFPTEIDLPITGLIKNASWDCIGGINLTSTDVNGKTTTTTYTDTNYWRPSSVQDRALNTTNFLYYNTHTAESYILFNGNTSIAEQAMTVDEFGRPRIAQHQEAPGGSSLFSSVQQNYDAVGRLYQASTPYEGSFAQATSSAPLTTTTYDAFARPQQTTDAAGGYKKFTYTLNDILQELGPIPPLSGENLKQKQMEYDALGRLTSVCEITNLAGSGACGQANPKNGYLTKYTYNATTTTVEQNKQPNGTTQTRTYVYDLLGRLVSETNPENGTTTYSFDSGANCTGSYPGDLVQKADAKGNTTCYTYDTLHRLTTVTYSGPDSANTPAKTFIYDTATVNGVTMTNAKGRLAQAYTGPVGSKITDVGFKYSARGEVLETYQSTPHSGGYYHPTTTYWPNGAVNTLWISQIPAITYGVDSMGRISTVSATSGQNPVTGTVYNLSTHKTTVSYGSLDSDEFTSDPNTGRLTRYKFNVGSNSLTGDLTWNGNGSLNQLAISDTIPGTSDTQTCSHTHDDLVRIATASCVNGATTKWIQSFTYDAFGNVKKASSGPGISFQPLYAGDAGTSTSPTNQFYQIGSGPTGASNYQDANGQVTYDGTHNYTWDVEHKLLSVDAAPSDCSTSGQCVIYDALGRMVEKRVGATYTQIVYGPSGAKLSVMNGQTLQKAWVPLPGGGTAIYTLSGLVYYRHTDHLGSSRLATTPNRTMYSSTAYAPYGEPYAQAGTTDVSFTGQNADTIPPAGNGTVPAMYDFLDRKYNPTQGRWLSPDLIGLAAVDPASPQSWNRYAYVMNNPLALIDPLGDDIYDGCSPDKTPQCYNPYYGSIFFSGSSAIGGGVDAYGNDYYDALLGAPGTYLTIDSHGNPGFGFDYGLYSATHNYIDNLIAIQPEGEIFQPPAGSLQVALTISGTLDGLVPNVIATQEKYYRLSMELGGISLQGTRYSNFGNLGNLLATVGAANQALWGAVVDWAAGQFPEVAGALPRFANVANQMDLNAGRSMALFWPPVL